MDHRCQPPRDPDPADRAERRLARHLWRLLEPYHTLTYFAPESRRAFGAAGLRGFWMGYFAGRSAPMGPVGPAVVAATFFNFAPAMVARSIPDAWSFATPASILDARLGAIDEALGRLLGPTLADPSLARAADLAVHAVGEADGAGRPLFAANAALPTPAPAHLALWWAATCLREHRGDGHVAAATVAGLDGCEVHVTLVATGALTREVLQPNRGWTDHEWDAAVGRLRSRGWLDAEGALTGSGRRARARLEADTDRLAAALWRRDGRAAEELAGLLKPVAGALLAAGEIPMPNPMGLPRF